MYVHESVRTYASASARVSGGDCRIKNNAVEGKGRGNGKVWWELKKARDDVRKEETGDVYSFVVILRVCTRKISIRNVSAQANENASVLVLPLLRVCVREGRGIMSPREKEDIKEDVRCQHDCEITGAIRDFPDPRKRRIHLNAFAWNWHGLWEPSHLSLTLTRATRFTIEKWNIFMVYSSYLSSKYQ